MSKLRDRYEQRKKEYDNYVVEKTRYLTIVETYLTKINNTEKALFSKFDTLPDDIKSVIEPVLPSFEEQCTIDNAKERVDTWRRIYQLLEEKGLELLGGDNNENTY